MQCKGQTNSAAQADFAQAIWDRLRMDDTSDQDILDQHVSRVWNDLTPGRSPGGMSPCPTNFAQRRPTDITVPPLATSKLFNFNADDFSHNVTFPRYSTYAAV